MSSTDSSVSSSTPSGLSSPVKSRPTTPATPATPGFAKKSVFKGRFKKSSEDYNFNAAHDITGIVMLDIQGAADLPKLRNSTFCRQSHHEQCIEICMQ